jgi:tagatose 1,6-diphosphate aldolase
MDSYSNVHTPAALATGIGLVLGIEASDDTSDLLAPRLLEGWTVERAAEAGADAVKISFPFDPQRDTRYVEQFVADVAAESHRCQLPLFAEPLGVWRSSDDRRPVTVAAAQRFGNLGVAVLKLEFPVDVAVIDDEDAWCQACAELDAASPVPWTVLSGGETFERFEAMVRVACDAGASGFVAGRAVWRECVTGGAVDTSEVERAAGRLEQLMAVVNGRARPWFGHPSWSTSRERGAR